MLRARGLYVKFAEYNEGKGFSEDASHFHRHYEIYFLLKGRRRYIIENEIYDVEAGDVILVPPMTMHKTTFYPSAPENEIHARLLYNVKEIHEELLPAFDKHFYRPVGKEREMLFLLINESVEEIKKEKESNLLHSINMQKLLYILKNMPESGKTVQRLTDTERLMQGAAYFIKENCEKNITLKQMAEETGFAREYFSVVFKKAIGSNFNDYLNNMRIARALHLLTETDGPVSKISEQCGFTDSNYFTYVFKKITGVSPTNYRKQQK